MFCEVLRLPVTQCCTGVERLIIDKENRPPAAMADTNQTEAFLFNSFLDVLTGVGVVLMAVTIIFLVSVMFQPAV